MKNRENKEREDKMNGIGTEGTAVRNRETVTEIAKGYRRIDAQVALNQIPGGLLRNLNMRYPSSSDERLMFGVGRGRRFIKKIVIKLNGLDLYEVTLIECDMKVSFEVKELDQVDNVYADCLGDIIQGICERNGIL